MTSLRFELDSIARRLGWPTRIMADATRALDAAVRRPFLRRAAKAAVDFACASSAVVLAIGISHGFVRYSAQEVATLALLVGLLLILADTLVGSYRTIWRYTSLPEARALSFAATFVFLALEALRAVGVVDMYLATVVLIVMFMLLLCVGVRGLRRWSRTEVSQGLWHIAAPRRVMIAGAGRHGLSIARELTAGGVPGVELVGFLDDDPAKQDTVVNGVPVLGRLQEALPLAERRAVSEVIVAMPDAKREIVRAFGRRLEDVGIRVRAVGGIARFVQGRDVHRPGRVTLDEMLAGMPPSPKRASPADSRRVLVTGGAGFIGSHLTRMLLARGYHVRVLDRFDYGRAGLQGLTHPRLEVLSGDICSSRDVSRALRDVHGVIALAAIVGDPACNLDPEETINLNYTATKVLIEACNFYGVRRIVFASSCSVYGASTGTEVLTEQSRLNPVSLYARTRVLSENILFDRAGDVEPVVLRLSTVFGLSPRMRFDLVVNTLTVRAVVDGKISIMGGNQWRPNVHCRDAARAFIRVLEAPAGLVAGEVFNVGGDANNHTIAQLGDMVAEIVANVQVAQQGEISDPRDYRVSFEKIRNTLGFEPEFTVAAGIREVAAAVKADPALRDYQNAIYHNVQALKQTFVTPRRRRTDWLPAMPASVPTIPPSPTSPVRASASA